MSYRALVIGLFGLVALAAAAIYAVVETILGFDAGLEGFEDDEFEVGYFAPGLIHGDD